MEEREVIVVGAGPGGAVTATALAQMGHDVLLLDRKSFPRDKTCGDAVPGVAIRNLKNLGMGEKIKAAESDDLFYEVNSLWIVSPRGYLIDADFPVWMG